MHQGRTGSGSSTESGWPPSSLLDRLEYPLVALLIAVFLVLGWRGRVPIAIGNGDDMIYLALSRSLESGSYREIFRASTPLHIQYPPGYPAWLVLIRHLVGEQLELIRATNLALVAGAFLLIYGAARRIAGTALALSLLLLLVLSIDLLAAGGSLYSEPLFLALSAAALSVTLRADKPDTRRAYAVIVFALLAFLTRSAGTALVPAIGVWLWPRHRRAELVAYAVGATLVVGGWFLYTAIAPDGDAVRSYAREFTAFGRQDVSNPMIAVAARVARNAVKGATELLPTAFSFPTIRGTIVDNLFWLGLNAALLITGFSLLWKSWRAAASYLVCYMGLLLMWPWPGGRLFAPILPFALLAFLLGAWHWAGRLPPRARSPVLGVLVAALALGAVPAILKQHAMVRRCDRAHPLSDPECYPGPKGGIVRAGEYLRLHVPPEKVVLAQSPVSVHYLSGHQAESVRLIGLAPPDSVMSVLRDWKIEFILVSDFQKFARGPAARALLTHCRQLWVDASFPPHTLLLTTVPKHDPSPNACAVLTEFSRGPAEESDDP